MEIKTKNTTNDSSLTNVSGLDVFKLKQSIREKQLVKENNQIVKK